MAINLNQYGSYNIPGLDEYMRKQNQTPTVTPTGGYSDVGTARVTPTPTTQRTSVTPSTSYSDVGTNQTMRVTPRIPASAPNSYSDVGVNAAVRTPTPTNITSSRTYAPTPTAAAAAQTVTPRANQAAPQITPQAYAQAAGVAPATVSQNTAGTAQGAANNTPEYVSGVAQGVYNEFNSLIGKASAEGQALIAQQFNSFIASLDATQQQITSMFQEQMGGIDPATQMALQQIKESAEQARNYMNEEMNRRGLLQSGIWVETSTRLQKNQLTAEQQLLSDRVTDLQNRLTSALMGFAQQRLDATRQFGQQSVDMAMRMGDQRVNAMRQSLGYGMDMAQFNEGQRQFDERMAQDQNQFSQKMNLDQQQFAWQQQQAAQRAAGSSSPTGMNKTQLFDTVKANAINKVRAFMEVGQSSTGYRDAGATPNGTSYNVMQAQQAVDTIAEEVQDVGLQNGLSTSQINEIIKQIKLAAGVQ